MGCASPALSAPSTSVRQSSSSKALSSVSKRSKAPTRFSNAVRRCVGRVRAGSLSSSKSRARSAVSIDRRSGRGPLPWPLRPGCGALRSKLRRRSCSIATRSSVTPTELDCSWSVSALVIAGSTPFVFIVTGEPSGDALGGPLIAALRQRTGGNLRVAGIGGERMQEQGLASLVPLGDLAVAGVAEVLPRAPVILRRVRQTVAAIRELRPDAVVTIDSSGFSWRVAQRLRRHGENVPLIHYVAPMG